MYVFWKHILQTEVGNTITHYLLIGPILLHITRTSTNLNFQKSDQQGEKWSRLFVKNKRCMQEFMAVATLDK